MTKHSRWRRPVIYGWFSIGCFVFIAVGWWLLGIARQVPVDQLLLQARRALQSQQWDQALELSRSIPPGSVEFGQSRLIAGEAASRIGRRAEALEFYLSCPREPASLFATAALSAGELERDAGHLTEALQHYLSVLDVAPENLAAHERAAFLFGVSGQRWPARRHLLEVMRGGGADWVSLVVLADPERNIESNDYVQQCVTKAPDDVLVQLGQAVNAFGDGQVETAREWLTKVVRRDPALMSAQAMLGELLVSEPGSEFADWHAQLPSAADLDPEIWFVRGLRSRHLGQLPQAARCFWECLQIIPSHRRASYQLGQVAAQLGHPSAAAHSQHADQLFQLTRSLDDVMFSKGSHEPTIRDVIEMLERMGRLWEAAGWAEKAVDSFSNCVWGQRVLQRIGPQLVPELPLTVDSENLARKYNLSHFPRPDSRLLAGTSLAVDKTATASAAQVQFDATLTPELKFTYINGDDPQTRGARVFEQNGGGVAAWDFDGDTFPDLYFTQGCAWRTGQMKPDFSASVTDRLFRNRGGKSFQDITELARLTDRGYGQGVTVGDINDDGFPDLYVAQIGQNQLYLNLGDGTFEEIINYGPSIPEGWTASCVIVDLNADGLPELFDVTYLTGPQALYKKICEDHACSPKNFDGLPDRLWINRGDGTFEWLPEAVPQKDSKGLGVVALDLHQRGRPSLFIANDQVPNYLLKNITDSNPYNLTLTDEAFLAGVAYNVDGLPMASMGIAADDVDNDGRVDFLVTTFHDEASMLFKQDNDGLFVDVTNSAGLRGPSLPYVGWGTQFVDADLDGVVDLITTNGHVDDYTREGQGYLMPPQYFRGLGQGKFAEQSATAGPFFQGKYLGRGLVKIDWNQDGLTDVAISHINQPAAILTNTTAGAGHWINLRLRARQTSRDAIGTIVEVRAGKRVWRKQLMAGDGYMAVNERQLQFGIGNSSRIDSVMIEWPSGSRTQIAELSPDVTLEVIETAPFATEWRDRKPQSITVQPQAVQAASRTQE